MAKVTDVFVSGSIGNFIFYRRMGTSCARIKASHVHQSGATKVRSVNFGIAAKAGKALRGGLAPCMPLVTDRSMQSRFSGAIAKWLALSAIGELPATDPVPFISSLEFTKGQPVRERFKVPFSISQPKENAVAVNINGFVPSKEISAPAGTGRVTLIISVAACLVKTGEPLGNETITIDIPYNDTHIAPQVLEFHVGIPSQSLLVIAGRLVYKKLDDYVWIDMNKESFMPAGVIRAQYMS